jgi:hypothetical protein
LLAGSGHKYSDPKDGRQMMEHHVDSCDSWGIALPLGGNLSVRIGNDRPLIIIGHDECIFKQYLISTMAWTLPSGETQIVPKDEGAGVMISAFQCREFGFGFQLNADQLKRINEKRKDTRYVDEEAANKYNGGPLKKDLTKSPFVQEFEYGINLEGYWNYERMVLQLEDVVDCLKTLYPNFDFLFMLDHSCGHDRQKPDSLNAGDMTVNFGGKQKRLHDSLIKEAEGYLGTFNDAHRISIGQDQSFVFKESDVGPFYMTAAERNERRNDKDSGTNVQKDISKQDLLQSLRNAGVIATGNKTKIQKLCTDKGIPIKVSLPKITEGWVNKPKGLKQVLWERGFIDESNLHKYTQHGKVDAFGVIQQEYSLHFLMSNCKDFLEEESLLQSMGRKMGVTIDRTPICHAELAGEGIEYSWGASKNQYRREPLSEKRKKDSYRKLVTKCLSEEILSKDRVRAFARRARSYICAYYQMHYGLIPDDLIKEHGNLQIERLAKRYKSHRSVVDFDQAFITRIIQSTAENDK